MAKACSKLFLRHHHPSVHTLPTFDLAARVVLFSVYGGHVSATGKIGNGDGSQRSRGNGSPPQTPSQNQSSYSPQKQSSSDLRTQNISIPSDMVGCIIGRSGTKITEIRRLSGSKISIAKTPHDWSCYKRRISTFGASSYLYSSHSIIFSCIAACCINSIIRLFTSLA